MKLTLQPVRYAVLALLLLNLLCATLVLGQVTEPDTSLAPEPTPTEEATTIEISTVEDQTTDAPTAMPTSVAETSTTEIFTTDLSTTEITTIDPTSFAGTPDLTTTSAAPTTTDPISTNPSPQCVTECLAQASSVQGCGYEAWDCLCPVLDAYLNSAQVCYSNEQCDPDISSQANQEAQDACSSLSTTSPSIGDSSTPISIPQTTPISRSNPPVVPTSPSVPAQTTPRPTPVVTSSSARSSTRLVTVTQTLVLTSGQAVTLQVSGTLSTAFTARSGITTTRVATILGQDSAGGNPGDPVGSGAVSIGAGLEFTLVFGTIGVMLGALFVL